VYIHVGCTSAADFESGGLLEEVSTTSSRDDRELNQIAVDVCIRACYPLQMANLIVIIS
jgi:hypothetical protein